MTKCYTDLNAIFDPYEVEEKCEYCGKVKCICDYEKPEPEICNRLYDGR